MGKLNKIFKISSTDFATLKETGQITKAGVTYKYDPDNLYLIENNLTDDYVLLGAGGSKLESELSVKKAQQDGDGAVIANTYVKKVSGKDLSTNDYTTAEKTKLAGIEAGANKVTKVSQLTNDNEYINNNSLYEANLQWGGKYTRGKISPVDCAMSQLHSANRLAFGNPDGITIEYSTDGGNTWVNYGADDSQKTTLVDTFSNVDIFLGKKTTGNGTINDMLRITLNAYTMGIYTRPTKLMLNVSTNGVKEINVKIDWSKHGAPDVYTNLDTYKVAGWSRWNSISLFGKLYTFGGSSTQSNNCENLRLTFSVAELGDTASNRAEICNILLFGETCWTSNSSMAKTGHLYKYDHLQNAMFPALIAENGVFLQNKYAPLSSVPQSLTTTDIDDAIK